VIGVRGFKNRWAIVLVVGYVVNGYICTYTYTYTFDIKNLPTYLPTVRNSSSWEQIKLNIK
jgi:uncharacterized membrane protein YhdT